MLAGEGDVKKGERWYLAGERWYLGWAWKVKKVRQEAGLIFFHMLLVLWLCLHLLVDLCEVSAEVCG